MVAVGVSPSGKASDFDSDIPGSIPGTPANLKELRMTFDDFMNQYYFIICTILFVVMYTSLIVIDLVQGNQVSLESYALGFILVASLSIMWMLVIPIVLLVLFFYGYIKLVRYIASIYVKRNRS